MMLFAIDIDGTLAVSGNWFARWMVQEAGLVIPEEKLARLRYGMEFWLLDEVRALSDERRTALKNYAHAHHKDTIHQEQCVPIPGAREALQMLVEEGGRIIYTTCRQAESQHLTQQWLAHYGFPNPEHVFCCEHYHDKYISAHQIAEPREPVVLVDDQIPKMVPAFRVLAQQDRTIALNLILRIVMVQIGQEQSPTFPFPVPFPVVACPSWRREDLEHTFQQLKRKQASKV